jgi:two-component system, NtrC family, sensor histidine kinase HydH
MNVLVCGLPAASASLAQALQARGHAETTTADRDRALELARTRQVDALILEGPPAEPLLDAVLRVAPDLPVILVGAEDTARAALLAQARGAFAYAPLGEAAPLDAATRDLLVGLVDRAAARGRTTAARLARVEENLRTRSFYENVLENVGQGIVVVDHDGKMRYHNPEAARILGEDEGPSSPVPGQTAVPIVQMLVDTMVEGKRRSQTIALEVEEQKVSLDVTTSLLRGADGRASGAIAIVSDRSTEKRLEEQLIHTERLATLGSLLASIAHEIMNVLTSITGCAEMGQEVARDADQAAAAATDPAQKESLSRLSGDIRQIFDTVLEAGISAQTIANNLLSYSRQSQPTHIVKQDVNELIQKTLRTLGKHLGIDKVSLTLGLMPGLPPVRLEPSKLQQALVNLVVNAVHALQEVPPPRRQLHIETMRDDAARQVLVRVEDTGPGISPRKMEKMFQPFFTTKGHGTGLGLYISRKVIQDQGGGITLTSEVGKGTQFTIHLPYE